MKTAVVVTGSTGFLGSHLVLQILESFPEHIVICYARKKGGLSAWERVVEALCKADNDCGGIGRVDHLLNRVYVIEGDLLSDTSVRHPAESIGVADIELESFWHCAAAIEFVDSQDSMVWSTNVDGLKNALTLAHQFGIKVFNHVSTAYASGTLTGRIFETIDSHPGGFNNIYEESKHHGEQLVHRFCQEHGLHYRLIRPSIIIGHSQTFNTSSTAGLYYCLEAFKDFHDKVVSRDPNYFKNNPLRVRVDRNATLNLIPIDIVIAEMIDLYRGGEKTLNQVFHITSESPVSLCDMAYAIPALLGITNVEIVDENLKLSALDRIFNRKLKVFNPYLMRRKTFDRSNVAKHGIDRHQLNYLLDLQRLMGFIKSYFATLDSNFSPDAIPREVQDEQSDIEEVAVA